MWLFITLEFNATILHASYKNYLPKTMREQELLEVGRPGSGPTSQQGNCKFCGSSHLGGSCPAFGKTCGYCQRKDHFARVYRKKLENLGGKTVHAMAEEPDDSDAGADLFTFSVESSSEWPRQDDWHVMLKIAGTNVNFKLDSGADCNVISASLFDRLPVAQKQDRQCKAKPKVYDGRKITPKGKASLVCEYKGKFTVLEFILVEQDLPPILGLKSCLELGLVQKIYRFKEEGLESEYADVFEGLGEIRGARTKSKLIPTPPLLFIPLAEFLLSFVNLSRRNFSEWRSLES